MSDAGYRYILAHGLNVHPSSMERLAEELELPSDRCAYICLPGHAEGESLRKVTARRWLDSFTEQYRAAYPDDSEVVFLGYSLGGLLMTHLLGAGGAPAPKKQILFAPALAFKSWTRLPDFIPAATFDPLLIPSLTPKRYKVNPGVTLGAYKVLFEISRELDHMDPASFNIPTLVLCDQRDELVEPEGLRKFIEQKHLSQWQLYILPSGLWERLGRKHLLVAREYQSDTYWKQLKHWIDDFLYA